MFPHTVTVYLTTTETDKTTMKDVETHYITVLSGVCLQASNSRNINENGIETADSVSLYIPLSVIGKDGKTGTSKKYVGEKVFWAADDKSNLWTLASGENCFFVKGKVIEYDLPVQTIKATYDDVYDITTINYMDYGDEMAHLEVGGA